MTNIKHHFYLTVRTYADVFTDPIDLATRPFFIQAAQANLPKDRLRQVVAYLVAAPEDRGLSLDELLSRSEESLLVTALTAGEALAKLSDLSMQEDERLEDLARLY